MVGERQYKLMPTELEELMAKAKEVFAEDSRNKIKEEKVILFKDEGDELLLDVFPESKYVRLYDERERLEEKPEVKKVLDLLEKAEFDFGKT